MDPIYGLIETGLNYRISQDREHLKLPDDWDMDAIYEELHTILSFFTVSQKYMDDPTTKAMAKNFLIDNTMMLDVCLTQYRHLFREEQIQPIIRLKKDFEKLLKYYQYY